MPASTASRPSASASESDFERAIAKRSASFSKLVSGSRSSLDSLKSAIAAHDTKAIFGRIESEIKSVKTIARAAQKAEKSPFDSNYSDRIKRASQDALAQVLKLKATAPPPASAPQAALHAATAASDSEDLDD